MHAKLRCMRIGSALLALTVLCAIAPSAQAAPGDPVVINSCNLMYDNSNPTATINGLDVQFTNNSSQAAKVVNIQTDINGTTETIRDEGSFAPGIEIHHRYKSGGEQFALPVVLQSIFGGKPQVTCTVSSVEFADGSRWPTAPGASAAASSAGFAITVSPTTLTLSGSGSEAARMVMASGGGALSTSSNCGSVATVDLLGSTPRDIALRVTPKASGSCNITVRDANDNVVTVPVTVH